MNPSGSAIDRFRLWYTIQPRGLRAIVSINVVVYLLWTLVLQWNEVTRTFVFDFLVMHSTWDAALPIRAIAYNFVHVHPAGGLSGLINIAFNMLWLFWLGKSYEEMHGAHRLAGLYVMGGIAAALLFAVAGLVTPVTDSFLYNPVPAVIAVVCGVALHYPNQGIGLFLLGVVRLRTIAIGLIVLELLVHPSGWAAYLGAAAFAFLFVRLEKEGIDLAGWLSPVFGPKVRRSRPAPSRSSSGVLDKLEQRLSRKSEEKPGVSRTVGTRSRAVQKVEDAAIVAEIDQSEVDRILDKISESGYDSLTVEEKKKLLEASQK